MNQPLVVETNLNLTKEQAAQALQEYFTRNGIPVTSVTAYGMSEQGLSVTVTMGQKKAFVYRATGSND